MTCTCPALYTTPSCPVHGAEFAQHLADRGLDAPLGFEHTAPFIQADEVGWKIVIPGPNGGVRGRIPDITKAAVIYMDVWRQHLGKRHDPPL